MVPWFMRAEARNMAHPTGIGKVQAPKVNATAYGPAGLGAAMHSGPYGSSSPALGHGSSIPHGPRGPRKAFEAGGHAGGADTQGPLTVGPVRSHVPGRTDHVMTAVPANSFVIPADVVSGYGEGNTEAGLRLLSQYFGTESHQKDGVDVALAGGEFVVSPESVAAAGGGNVEVGHKILDRFVIHARAHHVKTVSKLPGPVKK